MKPYKLPAQIDSPPFMGRTRALASSVAAAARFAPAFSLVRSDSAIATRVVQRWLVRLSPLDRHVEARDMQPVDLKPWSRQGEMPWCHR